MSNGTGDMDEMFEVFDDPGNFYKNDIIKACADLVGRAGARELVIGAMREGVPIDQAQWFATVSYEGMRLIKEGRQSPEEVALAMAMEILVGSLCKCTRVVSLSKEEPGCHWKLMGDRWVSGCDQPSVQIGRRGDHRAMWEAMQARIDGSVGGE